MFKKIIFASFLLVSFTAASAQSSSTFGIGGTFTPGACTVTMPSGGTANIGSTSVSVVKAWATYSTVSTTTAVYGGPMVSLPFTISCTAATKVGLAMTDNNPGKTFSQSATIDPVRYGIVNGTGTTTIGSFSVIVSVINIDGSSATPNILNAQTGSTAWSSTTAGGVAASSGYTAPGYTTAFSKTSSGMVPDAFSTLNGSLQFNTFLGKSIIDAATTTISPAGSGTLTLVYL